jgi:hypothetical protein
MALLAIALLGLPWWGWGILAWIVVIAVIFG